jgi:hypothetical protein
LKVNFLQKRRSPTTSTPHMNDHNAPPSSSIATNQVPVALLRPWEQPRYIHFGHTGLWRSPRGLNGQISRETDVTLCLSMPRLNGHNTPPPSTIVTNQFPIAPLHPCEQLGHSSFGHTGLWRSRGLNGQISRETEISSDSQE